MNTNLEVLNHIYQNAEMGATAISDINKVINDEPLKKQLTSQLNEYENFKNKASKEIRKAGEKPRGLSGFTKATSGMMIGINTLADKSQSHIAEMLIEGSTMGIVDITKCINDYQSSKDTLPESVLLAKELLTFEQGNVERYKKLL